MMSKKILSVSLAVLFLLSLVSCSESSSEPYYISSQTAPLHALLNNSSKYKDWYSVIANEEADEGVLSAASSKVASIDNSSEWATKLAKAILNSSQATDSIAKKLSASRYYPVWDEVAKWQGTSESTLYAVVEKVVDIDNSSEWATKLVGTILNSPQATNSIAKKLLTSCYYPVWNEVAKWQGTSESTLYAVVEKVVSMTNDSNYYWTNEIIANIVNYHDEYAEDILIQVASESADISHWIVGTLSPQLDAEEIIAKEDKAKRLAYAVVNSPCATPSIITILTNSDFESVRSMALGSLRNSLQ